MTTERIEQLVVEECGWKFVPSHDAFIGGFVQVIPDYWVNAEGYRHDERPSFCTSIDAIRAAAMGRFKTESEQARFHEAISDICARRNVYPWQLTATEEAEAFLRARGKWEES